AELDIDVHRDRIDKMVVEERRNRLDGGLLNSTHCTNKRNVERHGLPPFCDGFQFRLPLRDERAKLGHELESIGDYEKSMARTQISFGQLSTATRRAWAAI